MGVFLTINEVRNYIESKGCKLLDDEYFGNDKKLNIECRCGNKFTTDFATFKGENKTTCYECTKKKLRKEKGFSFEQVVEFLKERDYILLDEEYINCLEKMTIEDIHTGYRYFSCLAQAMNVQGRPYRFAPSNKYREYNFNIWIKNNNCDFKLSQFIKTKGQSKVELECLKCNKTWTALLLNIQKGQGCPYCNHRLPRQDNNLLVNFPEICKDWDYNKNEINPEELLPASNRIVWWKCHKCGYEWNVAPNTRTCINGTGCVRCNRSKVEKIMETFFINNSVIYEPQYRFEDCKYKKPLPFDFAIFYDEEKKKLKKIIEYDGELHYMPYRKRESNIEKLRETQRNDSIKEKYCKNNGIDLLRIPYWEKKNIESILSEELNLIRKEDS